MKAPTVWRHVGRNLVTAWLVLSGLFLLTRGLTDATSYLQTALEADSRIQAAERSQLTRQLLHRAGLDLPLFYISFEPTQGWQWEGTANQYHAWAANLLQGRLGTSYRSSAPVSGLLLEALRYTLPLTVLAAVLSAMVSVGLATTLNGRYPAGRRALLYLLHALQAAPLFLLATGLLLLFANPDVLAWFPAFGLGLEEESATWWQAPGRLLYHLALPVGSLVLMSAPALTIQLDAALQHELRQPYVATARAKGAAPSQVVWRHALRNALLPTITLLTELLPNLVAGAVVVEVLFALPGMGRLLAEAAATQDYPVLLGGVTLVVLARVVAQLLADALYLRTDPRIRLQA
ncbi:peptide/nickel transport system permease protein [Hymenobacter luteus]|uniref:Peptide/nickel transport system permease protein n=2 Tax=Hymenobacter TaxID=89966 RepID=A0A7W9SYI8_9BACT|nr:MULTISPECIES: ABC transporter permease [Hymenobacter]MBB4600151.1 peptide/nickel transport system permease protein [Hymenobacter latericoloratus]MBB6057539.1 peptide/nickel transport system permease protein [Hymenobacter luteus]